MEYCGSLVQFEIKYDIPVIPRREHFLIKYFSYLIVMKMEYRYVALEVVLEMCYIIRGTFC